MSSRDVLKRCCYRSLRENRKRTTVTILGIMMATALITAVASMAVSFRASLIDRERWEGGDYHYHFLGVGQEQLKYFENNRYIEKWGMVEEIGYAPLEGCGNPDKPYLYVSAIGEGMEEILALHLTEGRLPEDSRELLVSGHVRSNGSVDVKVGDILELEVGRRMAGESPLGQETPYMPGEETIGGISERQYRVVGIIERPNTELEPRTAPGYSAFTRLEEPKAEELDVYVSYTKQGLRLASRVTAGILGVPEELYERYYNGISCTPEEERQIRTVARSVQEHYWLLKWELLIFSSGTMNILYGMCAIAIVVIVVTSIFCIRNSFVISLTEKMKLYGRLSCVGTTSGQQRRIVHYEAAALGLVGIPLGVACGIGATAILVKAVGGLVEDAAGFALAFRTSLLAVLSAAGLSAVTVYASAAGSARRAARISPISAIRGSDTVQIRGKDLGCPAWIGRIYGIGGRIAYKSLRRARVKYRTTVVSIVVSVAVFIGMSTFVELMMHASDIYYDRMEYQLMASIYQWSYYGEALEIAAMEGVQEAEVVRYASFPVCWEEIDYTQEYLDFRERSGMEQEELQPVSVQSLGDEAYARFCNRLGVSVEEARDKAIVLADFDWEYWEDGKVYAGEGDMARFRPGDVIRGMDTAAGIQIEVLLQTEEKPMFMAHRHSNGIILIVSDAWMESQPLPLKYDNINVFVRCGNADEMETAIRNNLHLQYFTVTNYDAQYRSQKSMYLVIAIFLYGFITAVALIGITNIFNTITTNMELRAPEFAMLRSVGMTRREFRRMIWLEGMFYGGKALLVGIPLGILLSLCFNRAFGEGIVTAFRFPWMGIAIASGAVAVLLYATMHYSMSKINRKDIIETIQNENI